MKTIELEDCKTETTYAANEYPIVNYNKKGTSAYDQYCQNFIEKHPIPKVTVFENLTWKDVFADNGLLHINKLREKSIDADSDYPLTKFFANMEKSYTYRECADGNTYEIYECDDGYYFRVIKCDAKKWKNYEAPMNFCTYEEYL